jgi:hypothetical protein
MMMNRKQRLAAMLVFFAGCATGGLASQIDLAGSPANAAQGAWKYQCFQIRHAFSAGAEEVTDLLNRNASQGWELASDVGLAGVSRTCLRKQVQ